MKTVLACSRRHRPSSLAEPQAIQSPGRALGLISPQLTTRSFAARTIAPIKVKRTAMPSNGSCMSGLSRAETKKARRPTMQTIQQTMAINMIKLTAAVAEPAASIFDAMTLPMRAVRRSVMSRATLRRIIWMRLYRMVGNGCWIAVLGRVDTRCRTVVAQQPWHYYRCRSDCTMVVHLVQGVDPSVGSGDLQRQSGSGSGRWTDL